MSGDAINPDAESPDTGGGFAEIRIHGVGDHTFLSSLGDPTERPVNAWVIAADPPPIPEHRLSIINWSRATRKNTSFLWYVAFPFTLANVAGRMGRSDADHMVGGTSTPPGRAKPSVLSLCVAAAGLILSATLLAWLVVLGETVLRYWTPGETTVRMIPLTGALLVVGWLTYRWVRVIRIQRESPASGFRWLYGAHAAVVLATGAALAAGLPAQLDYSGWPSVATPMGDVVVNRLDAMALWIAVSTVAVFALSAILTIRYWLAPRRSKPLYAPLVLAGALLLISVLLLHSLSALIRMDLANILSYLAGLFGEGDPALTADYAVLLSYDSPAEAGDSRLDLFPFLTLLMVAAALLAAAVVLVLTPGLGLPPLRGKEARGRWWHRAAGAAVSLLPRVLPAAGILGAVLTTAAVIGGDGRLDDPESGAGLALAILALHLIGGAVILVVLVGQLKFIRDVLGKVTDVAGFWPIRDHPLAGVSYRDPVIAGIVAEAASLKTRRLVLVAHSQGSVICAWLIARSGGITPKPHLVTAGSPLESLFGSFFREYFTDAFFRDVSTGADCWVNYWRDTDPIGSEVRSAHNRELPDPDAAGRVRGHGDYWTAPELICHVRRLRDGGHISGSGPAAGTMGCT